MGDIEAGPLEAEGFEVLIGDEAGDAVDDRGGDGAVAVNECGAVGVWLQGCAGDGLLQVGVLCGCHERVC